MREQRKKERRRERERERNLDRMTIMTLGNKERNIRINRNQ